MGAQPNQPASSRRAAVALTLAVALAAGALALAGGAAAQDLRTELDAAEAELDVAKQKEGVLTTEIDEYSDEIGQLQGEVATLRNREAIVQEQLDRTEARLEREKHHLRVLRERLERSLRVLRERLVEIYKSDQPDVLTVILESDGFDDLVERYEYLTRIQDQDASIVGRVRDLRNESKRTVERVRAARDAIAAKKAELERTRMQLEARSAELDAVRGEKAAALSEIESNIQRLEGHIGELEGQIQAELQAAQSTAPVPAGPVPGETAPGPVSSSGFVWPVNGPVVSPFGMRWGRMHEGVDIAVPAGTPIHAAASGTIALASVYGGYGNYTCVDHGGGLATCYAHQSSFAVTSGSVSQGEVLGYVGCTGHCFGDHLHFEVRVNGAAVDPMGYL
jgi:murein DD-endopeptidase MepM/ murein hydrolase activator NlpD